MTDQPSQSNSPRNNGLGRSLFSSGAGILLSRVTGLVRDMAAAAYWGATGFAQAAYTTAFAIPNSLRALFGEGAFSSAFVPMVSRHIGTAEYDQAWKLANRAISVQSLALTAMAGLFAAVSILLWLTGTFSGNLTAETIVMILPLLMPFAILICVAGAFSAVLNSLKSFFLPNIVQIIFNVVQVATIGMLALLWRNDETVALLIFCGSTILSGLLQLLTLLIACRRKGYVFRFEVVWNDPEVKLLCLKILPGLVGAGVMQINSLIDKALGVFLGPAAVGALNYSHRLIYLPVGLFGVAMSMVCLPALSRAQARQDNAAIVDSLNYALRTVLFLALPCTAFFAISGKETITLLFARGAFQTEAIAETTWALAFYILGLPAFCCAKIATTPFHARLDTKTPMVISVGCMVLNLILNLILMRYLRQGGLALSTSICSWLNVAILLHINRRHLPDWTPRRCLTDGVLLTVAAIAAAVAAWWATAFAQQLLPGLPLIAMLALTFVIFAGAYMAACVVLRRPEPKELFRAVLTRK